MTTDTASFNKALIRRWFEEVWNCGNQELIAELRSREAVARGLEGDRGESRGPGPFDSFYLNFRETFPDLHIQINDVLADGDRVAVRFNAEGTHRGDALGAAPTGRRVSINGTLFVRIEDGKIVESWNQINLLSLLQQIGAIPESLPGADFLIKRR
jgi:steroid delta-isomerase-like uncharacterized protein